MANSSPEGIELGKGSKLESLDLFINKEKVLSIKQEKKYTEEDLRKTFDSAREFNSLDGIVDVHIVLPMGGDMSDLQPLYLTFEDFKNKLGY